MQVWIRPGVPGPRSRLSRAGAPPGPRRRRWPGRRQRHVPGIRSARGPAWLWLRPTPCARALVNGRPGRRWG